MKYLARILVFLLMGCNSGHTSKKNIETTYIYQSKNLAGHTVEPECNPGGTTTCACTTNDVTIQSFSEYGEVRSNSLNTNTWVNAIGLKKFSEQFPDASSIGLSVFKYKYDIRLPVLPAPTIAQISNSQAVHMMIQLWDGRNSVWNGNKKTLEAAIYWNLNPWETDYGKILIYTGYLVPTLIDTGLTLTPDTQWHQFELVANFSTKKYVSVKIDGTIVNLPAIDMAQIEHLDWGNEVSLGITTESMATFPGNSSCSTVFNWTTQFRDLFFSKVQ